MTKKLLPPYRAARLLRVVVHFSVKMLSRFLDPWSKAGADVLIEYVDTMWNTAEEDHRRKSMKLVKRGNPPSDEAASGKRHSL